MAASTFCVLIVFQFGWYQPLRQATKHLDDLRSLLHNQIDILHI